jgi:hypothetical protein
MDDYPTKGKNRPGSVCTSFSALKTKGLETLDPFVFNADWTVKL